MDNLLITDLVSNEKISYVGTDNFLAFGLTNMPVQLMNIELGFEMIVMCKKGLFQATIDNASFKVKSGQWLIITEDTMIHEFLVSQDSELFIIGFNWEFLVDASHMKAALWPMVDYAAEFPTHNLNAEELEAMDDYEKFMRRIVSSDNELYKGELIRNAVQSVIYEYIRSTKLLMHKPNSNDSSRNEQICRDFDDVLNASHGRIHSVSEVADLLHLTPKYLSKVIRAESGEKPLDLIHSQMMNEIRQELKFTDRSIKEIVYRLNFPSVSFFGKFVRQMTGMSPTALRKNLRESE